MLKVGSKGLEVTRLQAVLNKITVGGCKADGDFGPATKNAVIKFQEANGLMADGIAGPATKGKLPRAAQNRKLAANFSEREFACKHCGMVYIEPALAEKLQALRNDVAKPITITSGYRCPVHNKNVGGAPKSKHVLGQACDIQIKGMSPKQVAVAAEKVGFLGIGIYPTFTHVDLGPKRRW